MQHLKGIFLNIILCAFVYKYIHIVKEIVYFIRIINSVAVINNIHFFQKFTIKLISELCIEYHYIKFNKI